MCSITTESTIFLLFNDIQFVYINGIIYTGNEETVFKKILIVRMKSEREINKKRCF